MLLFRKVSTGGRKGGRGKQKKAKKKEQKKEKSTSLLERATMERFRRQSKLDDATANDEKPLKIYVLDELLTSTEEQGPDAVRQSYQSAI